MTEIRHTADGTPYARPYLGKDGRGRPVRPYREFAGMTDAEAHEAAERWVAGLAEGRDRRRGATAREALTEYIDRLEALGNSHNTVRMYRHYTARYLLDLAERPVSEITTRDLDANLQALLTEGPSGARLAPSTVQTYRAFLQGAWKTFVKHGLAPVNVARDTMRAQSARHEARALDETDADKLIAAVRNDLEDLPSADAPAAVLRRNEAMAVLLALYTGARVGEVAALRIRDTSIRAARVTISGNVVVKDGRALRQDKTKGKRTRTVSVDPDIAATLRTQADWLKVILPTYGKDTPVCTTNGQHMRPGTLSYGFTRYRRELGLDEGLTYHSLRHTHATLLLQQGVNPRVIQERLGHADVRTTLAIYGHVMPANDGEAARLFSECITN